MSIFAVTIERIASVWPHPNADRLELAQLASMTYQFVIPKDTYHAGDLVVYFPIDSLLPPNVITALGLSGKLAGHDQNRVKTMRLRGVISQGIVATPEILVPSWDGGLKFHEGQDITELLGVTKYEPPLLLGQEGPLGRLPPLVSVYDIEGAERFVAEADQYLMDQPVLITEKLEGSHFSASIYASGEIIVCRRRYSISADHAWYQLAEKIGLLARLPDLKREIDATLPHPSDVVTIRGEVVGPGIQANHYKLPKLHIYLFEIEVDGAPLGVPQYMVLIETLALDHVPTLAANVTLREWLAGRSLADASNGQSVLNPAVRRKGVVIRPIVESRDERLGRVILKQRSPEYLVGSDF